MDIDWFGFENKDLDFPFYRKNPYVPKWGWFVLLFLMLFGLLLSISEKLHITILACVVLIVPVLYFLKWDYKAIFQKPKIKEVALAVGLFAGYIVYALLMSIALDNLFGLTGGDLIVDYSWNALPPLFFSIMAEEIVKFIPFMFFLRVCFKYSNKRKLAVIFAMAVTMVFFASLHAWTFKMFLYALCIQGFGSIFEFFGYIKTKNILISYITHICTDVFIIVLGIMGM